MPSLSSSPLEINTPIQLHKSTPPTTLPMIIYRDESDAGATKEKFNILGIDLRNQSRESDEGGKKDGRKRFSETYQ